LTSRSSFTLTMPSFIWREIYDKPEGGAERSLFVAWTSVLQ